MTRYEAKQRYAGMPIVFQILDVIYDDFESRTCESCKYYYPDDKDWNVHCDYHEEEAISLRHIENVKDFSCNKYEPRSK